MTPYSQLTTRSQASFLTNYENAAEGLWYLDDSKIEPFSAWIDGQLGELETRFGDFVTRKSTLCSMGR